MSNSDDELAALEKQVDIKIAANQEQEDDDIVPSYQDSTNDIPQQVKLIF
jgi:hypothetical protein